MVTATETRLTYQDYLALDAPEGTRYELINGELILLESPSEAHQSSSAALGSRMHVFTKTNRLGQIFLAPYDVLLSDADIVQPDILFVSNERAHIRTPANVQGAPDLVVEILSPFSARRDWIDKLELYSKRGVKEYWIVDTFNRAVYLLTSRGGKLTIADMDVFGMSDVVSSSALAGFSVKVDDIF